MSLPPREQSTIDSMAAAYDVSPEIVLMALLDWLGEMVETNAPGFRGEARQGENAEAQEAEVTEESLEALLPQALDSLKRANAIAEQTILESRRDRVAIVHAAREIDRQLTQIDRSLAELMGDGLVTA